MLRKGTGDHRVDKFKRTFIPRRISNPSKERIRETHDLTLDAFRLACPTLPCHHRHTTKSTVAERMILPGYHPTRSSNLPLFLSYRIRQHVVHSVRVIIIVADDPDQDAPQACYLPGGSQPRRIPK